MSDKLDKAREQVAAAHYKKALNTLWEVENAAKVDPELAAQVLDVARSLNAHLEGSSQEECDRFVRNLEQAVARLTNPPAHDAIVSVMGCEALGGQGLPVKRLEVFDLLFKQAELRLNDPLSDWHVDIPYTDVTGITVEGQIHKVSPSHGRGYNNYLIDAAVIAAVSAVKPNWVTSIWTVISLKTSTAELSVRVREETPDALRERLSPVFAIMRQLGSQAAGQSDSGGEAEERTPAVTDV
jgi:hypothetical protein